MIDFIWTMLGNAVKVWLYLNGNYFKNIFHENSVQYQKLNVSHIFFKCYLKIKLLCLFPIKREKFFWKKSKKSIYWRPIKKTNNKNKPKIGSPPKKSIWTTKNYWRIEIYPLLQGRSFEKYIFQRFLEMNQYRCQKPWVTCNQNLWNQVEIYGNWYLELTSKCKIFR